MSSCKRLALFAAAVLLPLGAFGQQYGSGTTDLSTDSPAAAPAAPADLARSEITTYSARCQGLLSQHQQRVPQFQALSTRIDHALEGLQNVRDDDDRIDSLVTVLRDISAQQRSLHQDLMATIGCIGSPELTGTILHQGSVEVGRRAGSGPDMGRAATAGPTLDRSGIDDADLDTNVIEGSTGEDSEESLRGDTNTSDASMELGRSSSSTP